MSFWSLFQAKYPYDRGPHGILIRYLQNFRYFTFFVTVLWLFMVMYFNSAFSNFSIGQFGTLFIIGAVYLIAAEIAQYLTYSRCPESADVLIKLFGIADITIITSGVILSGGVFSPFVLMYLFPVANFRILYGNKGSFLVTAVCLVFYFAALMTSTYIRPLAIINFLAVVVPCFFAFNYYFGLILESERNSRMEKVKIGAAYNKSMLLYNLSKELNETSDFKVICDKVFEAIDPIVAIKGMKVLFDEDQAGSCKEIYSYETEPINWCIDVDYDSGEELGLEVLKTVHCESGFYVLPFGEKAKSGMLVLRGSNEEVQPEQYEVYLKTVAEIAAASFQNTVTLKRLAQQSVSDGLTNLPNKRYFSLQLEETVNRCKRYKMNFVIGMLDIDHFKSINDKYGHVFGDFILKSCAQTIQQTLRSSDLVARYGGEEFGIILPHTDLAGALRLMERVRKRVEEKVFVDEGESCRITVSIGIAAGQSHLGATETVKLADRALYVAKKSGRNQVICDELHNKH